MAALDFPGGATTGTVYTGTNGVVYVFDGIKWDGQTAASLDFANFTTDIIPSVDNTYQLGSPSKQWKDVFVSTGSIYIGNIKLSNDAGQLVVQQVSDPGEETEEPLPDAPGAVTTDRLVNGTYTFVINSSGSLELNGEEFSGGSGEAVNTTTFAYIRLTDTPFIFEPYADDPVTFTNTDYGSLVDNIDTDIAITRGENQGIYNPLLEINWDDTSNDGPSPVGTAWNVDGWTDLTNLNQRTYYSFYEAFDGGIGNKVLASEAIMKDVANNRYYKFDFTVWGNSGSGAPVTYTRTELDPVTGADLGSPVEFVKAGYADPTVVNDPIDTDVTLTRGNNQSIFNIALETAYNDQGDGQDSPEGTLWNAEGWGTLDDVTTRSYSSFYDCLGGNLGNNVIGKELVMHDTINNKYHTFKFSSWTQSGNGGGFEYTRQEINTSQLFVKPDDDTSTVDIFIADDGSGAGIGITRDTANGIYNPYREGSWDEDVSPGGTAWNTEGWDDLSDIETRTYSSFYAAFGSGGLGNKVVGTECVMFIPENGKYYAIKFLSWTQGGGGGFSYLRYEIDLDKLNEGVRFADGTVLKSAEGVGRVKLTASNNRKIEEVYGSKTIELTPVVTASTVTASAYSGNSGNQSNILIVWDADLVAAYDAGNNFSIEVSLDQSTWYLATIGGWSNNNYVAINLSNTGTLSVDAADTVYYRIKTGGTPVVWWDKAELPGGSGNFRGAVIDYHAYTGEATIIGTIHIVDDDGEENITHTEVSSGSSDSENDYLWVVQNEGTISYRRIDGEGKVLKVQWAAKVFYGSELYD